jgi:hypothetical protein
MACEVFEISRSCYYYYRKSRKQVDVERIALRAKVNQALKLSRSSAGSRTIKTMLNDQGIEIGRFKVGRLMAGVGLICKQPGPQATNRPQLSVQIYPIFSIDSLMSLNPIKFGVVISPISGRELAGRI